MKPHIRYKLLGIGITFWLLSQMGYAWKAVYYLPKVKVVYYDIRQESRGHQKHIHWFAENIYYPIYPGPACCGINPLQYGKLAPGQVPDSLRKQKAWYYLKVFDRPITCQKDTTKLTLFYYQQAIRKFSIYLHTTSGGWVHKVFTCDFDGYQYPLQVSLSDFFESDRQIGTSIDKLLLIAEGDIKHKKEIVFSVNQFTLADVIEQEKTFFHPFWDRLFHRPEVDSVFKYMDDDPASLRNTYYYTLWNQVYLLKEKTEEEELPLIKEIIELVLHHYPFYQERELDKKIILQKLQALYADSSLFADEHRFLEVLASFLRTEINDGHFFLRLPFVRKKKLVSPVRLYEIGGKIIVSAVFDSIYNSELPLGTEVLSINGRNIQDCINDLKSIQYGVEERKRSRAIALLLNRAPGDSVTLKVKRKNSTVVCDVVVKYPASVTVPADFSVPQALFEQTDGVSYFRIAQMDGQVFLRFANHFEEIKHSKGLILDVRGNGGGSPDGEILFSTFIQHPTVFKHTGFKNSERRRESVLIRPHPTLHFSSDFPVVILADENTACASEAFILAMKQLDNCWFFSHSPTAGSLQDRHGVWFPSGIFLSLDCLAEKQYSLQGEVVENAGLQPDIWIQYRRPEDLAAYSDLLKKKAIEFIQLYERNKSLLRR